MASPDSRAGGFDWAVYSDATFAALSILIPIPLLDLLFVRFFRRRIPRSIADRHGRTLDRATLRALDHESWSLAGCLLFPLWLALMFLKRLFRTVFYFLTIKEATDLLSLYWHRAFLIDHSLRRGHLDRTDRAPAAVAAIASVLETTSTSPARTVAAQVVSGVRHVLRTVIRLARFHVEDDVARATHERLERGWIDLAGHFDGVARDYERVFAALERSGAAGPADEPSGVAPPRA